MSLISKARNEPVTSNVPAALVRFSWLTVLTTIIGTVMLVALSATGVGFSWADTVKTMAYMFLLGAVSTAAGSLVPTLVTKHASTFRDWCLITLVMALAIALADNPLLSWRGFLDSLIINFPLPLVATALSVLAFVGLQALKKIGRGNARPSKDY
ncbi:hypothetical protein GCM10009596_17080 [Arthrobacter rhombi]|uniref:hypothetical protein n=1 Tax=Arthrobacter rhombi TaxID=71253 RepID=UPI0031E1BDB1